MTTYACLYRLIMRNKGAAEAAHNLVHWGWKCSTSSTTANTISSCHDKLSWKLILFIAQATATTKEAHKDSALCFKERVLLMFSHAALFSFILTSIRGMKKKNETAEQLIKIPLGLKKSPCHPETGSTGLSK